MGFRSMLQRSKVRDFEEAVLPPGTPQASRLVFRSLGTTVNVARGHLIEPLDGAERQIIFISHGTVKLVGHVGADREQIVAFAFDGELLVLSVGTQTPYELYAVTDCQLLIFSAGKLFRAAAVSGPAATAILDRALLAIDRSREKSVLLGRKTAKERMATFLVSLSDRIGEPLGETISMTLPMSRRDIADSLGLTIETVSRQLTELRECKVVDTCGRSEITILDVTRLRDIAGTGAAFGSSGSI